MAADDDKNEAPDPWADLVADDLGGGGLGEGGEGPSFDFVDDVESPSADASVTPPEDAAVDDAEVGEWLNAMEGGTAESDGDAAAPPLSVFSPDEQAVEQASPSSIEIGTGFSGIDVSAGDGGSSADDEADGLDGWTAGESTSQSASDDDFDAFPVGPDAPTASGFETADIDAGDTVEPAVSFHAAMPAAAAATAVAAMPRSVGGKPPAKGGLAPMIGVLIGGVLAVPITLAILLWGFQRDPFGVAKQVPESMAFLVPQKFRPGFKRRAAPVMPAPSLEDVAKLAPAADATAPVPVPAEPDQAVAEPAAEPALPDAAEPAVAPLAAIADAAPSPDAIEPPAAVEPGIAAADPPFPDPDASTAAIPDPLSAVTPPAAASPPPAVAESAPPVVPPLDLAPLEAAVADAAVALEAAAAVEDHSDLAGKKLLVGWYRALARTADELVRLQNEAADSGRPLEGTEERLVKLHAGIAARSAVAAALPQLASDWLAYSRRDSEGILLPVTFNVARKVGPYWRSKVTLEDGAHSRELAVITREEPAAVAGDLLLVTGIVFDGDVIWAADVRSPGTEPAPVAF